MSEGPSASELAPRTLASQLNRLFDMIRPEIDSGDGRRLPYSRTRQFHNNELASHVGVTPSYVSQMKRGKKPNPTTDILKGTASFFDVPASYFLCDAAEAARIEAQIQFRVDLRRFEDGELPQPPVDPASLSPHRQLPGETPRSSATLCERLNWLFEHVQPLDAGRAYTDEEVAAGIGERAFVVRGLRTGEMTDSDVSVPVLRNLAGFFGKKLDFLYADEQDAADTAEDEALVQLIEQFEEVKLGLVKVATRRLAAADPTGARHDATRRVLERLLNSHLAGQAAQPLATRPTNERGR